MKTDEITGRLVKHIVPIVYTKFTSVPDGLIPTSVLSVCSIVYFFGLIGIDYSILYILTPDSIIVPPKKEAYQMYYA